MIVVDLMKSLSAISKSMKNIACNIGNEEEIRAINRIEGRLYNSSIPIDLIGEKVDENFRRYYKMNLSKRIRLSTGYGRVIYFNMYDKRYCYKNSKNEAIKETFILKYLYPIHYTIGTETINIMFCFVNCSRGTSRIICLNSDEQIVRNDFVECINRSIDN